MLLGFKCRTKKRLNRMHTSQSKLKYSIPLYCSTSRVLGKSTQLSKKQLKRMRRRRNKSKGSRTSIVGQQQPGAEEGASRHEPRVPVDDPSSTEVRYAAQYMVSGTVRIVDEAVYSKMVRGHLRHRECNCRRFVANYGIARLVRCPKF